ncbi:MAG: hypothetical protein AB8G22_16915 [Saprospiraceae bacterium]
MKLTVLVLFFLGLGWQVASAQFQNKTYQMESIYLKGGRYIKNGIASPIGMFGGGIEKEFIDLPMTSVVFKRYQRNQKITSVLRLVGIGGLVGALLAFPNGQEELGVSLYLTGLLATSISIPLGARANNDLQQAIWMRNGEILR